MPGGFAAIYPVLRAMEDAGQCRRGYFVEGLGAAQFALPGAVDRMRALATEAGSGETPADPWARAGDEAAGWHAPSFLRNDNRRAPAPGVTVLAAGDPANPFGAALPWPERPGEAPGGHRPGRKAGSLVVLADGELVLYVERGGKTLLSWNSDPAMLGPAAAALAGAARGGALGRLHHRAGRRLGGPGFAAGPGPGGGRVPAHAPRPEVAGQGGLTLLAKLTGTAG